LRSDPELVALTLKGEERAFRELVDRYRARIYTFVLRIVKDREEAGDIAQEAFIKVYSSLRSYDPSRNFSSWLFKIAQNIAIDYLRKRRPEEISLDATFETGRGEVSLQIPSRELEPDRGIESMEIHEAIEIAVADLGAIPRSAVLLRHVEGKSYEEIAEILGIPLGTVKTHIFRARRLLRAKLKDILPGHRL
jgi:RNA polymerase sigma-70 factor (ECF subfamily)